MNTLFNKQLIKKYLNTIEITDIQKEAINYWNSELIKGNLVGEEKNYTPFENTFLVDILGYDSKNNILRHDKEKTGSGRSEFKLKFDDVFMIIELKGSNVNLDKSRNDKNETPVDQLFRYATKNEGVEWLLLSNYDEFRLYNYHKPGKYISWKMEELIRDENKLKEFIFILSKKSFKENLIDTINNKTFIIEEEFNDEFYQLYSETRLMLIHDLEVQSNIDRLTAIHYAQLIMDRIIFICFAEDKELLPEQILEKTLINPIKEGDIKKHRIFDRLRELFEDIHEGNPIKKIPEYNGGLFEERLWFLNIKDTIETPHKYYENCIIDWNFENESKKIDEILSKSKESINPIYKNILVMASFDFDSDVDVNILGHIFESSIGDIEKLKEDNSETRHKFGIHYTPTEITEYICKNTIIPYLSKSNNIIEIPELLSEYSNDLDTLDNKLKNIKILDPACGSGSMLNKAVDLLLEIHQAIYNKKYENDSSLDKWWDGELVRRDIIINNIYGVDLNEESVEITKLGLFLKICKKDKKLPTLDNNIKCGNSLIQSNEIAGKKSFNWEEKFEEIIKNGGFDVIIGNPPYVRVQEIEYDELDYYSENFDFAMGHIDMSILFIELANKLIKSNGKIGFITSNMFLTTDYGLPIRKYLTSDNNLKIDKIIDFGDLPVFKDALTYVSIFIFTKTTSNDFEYYYVKSLDENLYNINFNKIHINDLNENKWILKNYSLKKIFEKIENNKTFQENHIICNYGTVTGLDTILAFKSLEDISFEREILIPFLRADQCERYMPTTIKEHIIYPYFIVDNKLKLIPEEELKIKYPLLYNYLLINKEELECRKDSRKTLEGSKKWYKLIRPGNPNTFSKEKIVYQGLCKENKFTYDKTGSACVGGGVFYIISNNDKISLKFILGILNSKLIEIYLHSITPLKKGGYHKYSTRTINNIPLALDSNIQKKIEYNVNSILELNNKFITETEGFKKWLKRTFNISKLSNKLENYYELDFEEFLNQLKNRKINISKRTTQNLLENEFTSSIDKLTPLKNNIKKIEENINHDVFELYGLNQNEIQIINDLE